MNPRIIIGLATAGLLAACGSTATASNSTPSSIGSATGAPSPVATSEPTQAPTAPPAPSGLCASSYNGQTVDVSGTSVYGSLALGNNFEVIVKDAQGTTCQVITNADPGPVGAHVSFHGYVAYVSPGTPPINRVAYPAYAQNDK